VAFKSAGASEGACLRYTNTLVHLLEGVNV
jgi:hypothetical protein